MIQFQQVVQTVQTANTLHRKPFRHTKSSYIAAY